MGTALITSLERNVCELYAEGKSLVAISNELGIPENTVSKILKKPECKNLVEEIVMELNAASKIGRVRILNKVIEDKIKKIEENGGDFSTATKKDLVDLIAIMDNILKEKEKAELGNNESTVINILQQVLD